MKTKFNELFPNGICFDGAMHGTLMQNRYDELGQEQINYIEDATLHFADMYEMLESTCIELYSLINEVNKERLSKVHSQTETPPDLHDMETCHSIQQLLKRARGE